MKLFHIFLAFALFAFGVGSASAAAQSAIDVSDVTGTLTNQVSSITSIGIGILVLAAIITGIAFVRRAASGR